MKVLASGFAARKERNTSPQAQWKKCGMVPRIFPCVPLPEPGAPNNKMVWYFMRRGLGAVGGSGVFVFDVDFLDFQEGYLHFLRGATFMDFQMHVVGGDPRNTGGDMFAPGGFDD